MRYSRVQGNGITRDIYIRGRFLAYVFSSIALIVSLIILNDENKFIYKYIYFIPFTYCVVNCVFIEVYRRITLSTGIVLAFCFVRYCLSPMLVSLEGYPRSLYTTNFNDYNALYSTLLMVYEMALIYFALYRFRNIDNGSISYNDYKKRLLTNENFFKLNPLIYMIVLFTLCLFAIWPSLFNNYTLIFNSNMDSLISVAEEQQKGLPGGMRWIGYTCGEAVRYIIIEHLILRWFQKHERTSRKIYWGLSFIIISLNSIITTSRIMMNILMSVVFIAQLYKLYPQRRKLLGITAAIALSLGIVVIAFTYWGNMLKYTRISQVVQGYTNGYYNVYTAKQAYDEAQQTVLERIQMFFVGDGIGYINILSRLVDDINSSDIYNYYAYGRAFNGGAVIPYVSQFSYYFTPLLGPFASYFSIKLMKKFERNASLCRGSVLINSFASVVCGSLMFMYYGSLILHIFTVNVLPIYLLAKINKKFV